MTLNLVQPVAQAHGQIAGAVGWNAFTELFSCSDDHTICRWSSTGDLEGKVGLLSEAMPCGSLPQHVPVLAAETARASVPHS